MCLSRLSPITSLRSRSSKTFQRLYKWRSRVQSGDVRRRIAGWSPKIQRQGMKFSWQPSASSYDQSTPLSMSHFAVTWNDIVNLWLRISHFWGFHLLHLGIRPVIYVLSSLAVQERGQRTCSCIVITYICVLCPVPKDASCLQVVLRNVYSTSSSDAFRGWVRSCWTVIKIHREKK